MTGPHSEQAILHKWWWCRCAARTFDDIERFLSSDLENMGETIPFDDEVIFGLEDLAEHTSAWVDGDPRFEARLLAVKGLREEVMRIARRPATKEQIRSVRQRTRDLSRAHDWLDDWSEEEWMLVHYWSKADVPADQRGDG